MILYKDFHVQKKYKDLSLVRYEPCGTYRVENMKEAKCSKPLSPEEYSAIDKDVTSITKIELVDWIPAYEIEEGTETEEPVMASVVKSYKVETSDPRYKWSDPSALKGWEGDK